jgi:hypothetical protein
MKCTNATKFNRKSGGAKWRDLLFILRSIESQWEHHPALCHPERSRGICSSADLSWECFSTERTCSSPHHEIESIVLAIDISRLVSPPLSCETNASRTLLYRISMSG